MPRKSGDLTKSSCSKRSERGAPAADAGAPPRTHDVCRDGSYDVFLMSLISFISPLLSLVQVTVTLSPALTVLSLLIASPMTFAVFSSPVGVFTARVLASLLTETTVTLRSSFLSVVPAAKAADIGAATRAAITNALNNAVDRLMAPPLYAQSCSAKC